MHQHEKEEGAERATEPEASARVHPDARKSTKPKNNKRVRTFWQCASCGYFGGITHAAHVGAWEMLERIREAHGVAVNGEKPCPYFSEVQVCLSPAMPRYKRQASSSRP